MRLAKPTVKHRLYLLTAALAALAPTGQASVRALDPADYASHSVTCEFPVRLTRDCSIWQGATRPIAFGDYRMRLAADSGGRTILVSQLRLGPSHNGQAFRDGGQATSRRTGSMDVIRGIRTALEDRGIHLERLQPIRSGRRVNAYLLEFSTNAYDYLKQFTVLESEYWLPKTRSRIR